MGLKRINGRFAAKRCQPNLYVELRAKIQEAEAQVEVAEATFKAESEKLQQQHADLEKARDDAIAEAKQASSLGVLKQCKVFKAMQGESADS